MSWHLSAYARRDAHPAEEALEAETRAVSWTYLERSDDPMLARLALPILCNHWGLTERYLPVVRHFIEGVEWDDDRVQLVALSIAGRYLRKHVDPGLLDLLLETTRPDAQIPEAALRAQSHSRRSLPLSVVLGGS